MTIQKRRIPGTELDVSVICMGTGEIGSSVSQDDSFRLFDSMAENGGNFIDTAKDYGDWVPDIERSASEKVVGRWLESRGARKQIVVATKGCMPDAETTPNNRCAPHTIRRHIEWSQNTLRVDTIDIWYVHKDDPACSMEDMLDTLHGAQREGRIRHYALSNASLQRVQEAQAIAARKRYDGFIGVQGLWNPAVLCKFPYGDPQVAYMNSPRYAYHASAKLPWFAFQATAFGLFHRMAANTLDSMNPGFRSIYHIQKSKRRYEALQRVARSHGAGLTETVLSYIYSNPDFASFPIVGSHKPQQVIDNFSSSDLILSPDEITAINSDISFELE